MHERTMLDPVIRFFLTQKLVVVLIVLLLIGAGLAVAPFDWDMGGLPRDPVPVDAMPNLGENQQIVFTDWPGRSPQDVEDQVTYPLTVNLMGMPGVKEVRSSSAFGFSMVFIIFEDGIEWDWSRAKIIEKLSSLPAGTLPDGVAPTLGPDATALGQVFWYTLEGRGPDGKPVGGWDLAELRSVQDWLVRYGLLGAEGITEVASIGGYVPEYLVEVDPDALRQYAVTLPQVLAAVRESNLDVGAGVTEINQVEYVIRGVGFVETLEDIERTVIEARADHVPVRVGDVATISRSPAPRRGALTVAGAEAVGGVAVVTEGYNPLQAIHNVKAKIAEIRPGLPARAVIDWDRIDRDSVRRFAEAQGLPPLPLGGAGGGDHRPPESNVRADDATQPEAPSPNPSRVRNGEGSMIASPEIDQDAWLTWLRDTPREQWPEWVTISQLEIVPFYDRTDLIYATLGTLSDALVQQILVTMIVVLVMVVHLRSALVISAMLPLAVLVAFILMKLVGVDANVVALAGIAIAIGTIVDMGVIVTENVLKHLNDAPPDASRLEIVFRGTQEVGSAILTAISTTIISFLPVFTMTGAEGKMFIPLAYTKTFVLLGAIFVALAIVPAVVHVVIASDVRRRSLRRGLLFVVGVAAVALIAVALVQGWGWVWPMGLLLLGVVIYHLLEDDLPAIIARIRPQWSEPAQTFARGLHRAAAWVATAVAALVVGYVLAGVWEPLGPERGMVRNFLFVVGLIGGLLALFWAFMFAYPYLLGLVLRFKFTFLTLPVLLMAFGLGYVWWGPVTFFGPLDKASHAVFANERDIQTLLDEGLLARQQELVRADTGERVQPTEFEGAGEIQRLIEEGVLARTRDRLTWTATASRVEREDMESMLQAYQVGNRSRVLRQWQRRKELVELSRRPWREVEDESLLTRARWKVVQDWEGLGREFMPPFDEGAFLWMPTTMPHASIGEALDVLTYQDLAIASVPEVEGVFGKIGRTESALDPAPISMVETVIHYKSEYITDAAGRRVNFQYDAEREAFVRDAQGELIPDTTGNGRPYRQWRDHIDSPDDIWNAIVAAAALPGVTSAPKLQPIETRQIMLQTGMRAPMGIKLRAPDLETLNRMAVQLEGFVREVPSVRSGTVNADRVVGKPYLEIHPDREAIGRYGLRIADVQAAIQTAVGGTQATTTVEGRERYPVRVRYAREQRQDIEAMERVLLATSDGAQIPLSQVAEIRYARGPQMIKSENTFLTAYVTFGPQAGMAEVDVVEQVRDYLDGKVARGELTVPQGVSWRFAGNYEHQQRAAKTLMIVLPIALLTILLILYFQFRSLVTTLIVAIGIGIAWAGGFTMIYWYGQPWFANFDVFGVNMRDLFNLHPINLSIAVWVGFLALFGIAVDDGVVMATYLKQRFERDRPTTIAAIRKATLDAGLRRVRPCLITSATTILALLPVLTATGTGADIMIPMAIPSVGGMFFVLLTMFSVPVLYCLAEELKLKWRLTDGEQNEPAPAPSPRPASYDPASGEGPR
ncbi:MAG: efflux RND transporter permease subunit [Phycisphaeraceae bacterium]